LGWGGSLPSPDIPIVVLCMVAASGAWRQAVAAGPDLGPWGLEESATAAPPTCNRLLRPHHMEDGTAAPSTAAETLRGEDGVGSSG
jgi:hypothetical protein